MHRIYVWFSLYTIYMYGSVYTPYICMVSFIHRIYVWCCLYTAYMYNAIYTPYIYIIYMQRGLTEPKKRVLLKCGLSMGAMTGKLQNLHNMKNESLLCP